MIDSDGGVVKTFNSIAEAVVNIGVNPKQLKDAIKNHTEYKHYRWRYKRTFT